MWFLLLVFGAIVVQLAGVPASRRLPLPPAPELLLATWFLFATAVRMTVLGVRLAALERKAQRLARRTTDKAPSPIGELGLGVGRGALQAVSGDILGASLAVVAGLLRGAAHSLRPTPSPQRERRRSERRERRAALTSVIGVGVACAGLAWWPLVGGDVARATLPALRAVGLAPEAAPPRPSPRPAPLPRPTVTQPAAAPSAVPSEAQSNQTAPAVIEP